MTAQGEIIMSHRSNNERPVRPHTLDRREAKKAIAQAFSRPVRPQQFDKTTKK